jgi:hypothetical protein
MSRNKREALKIVLKTSNAGRVPAGYGSFATVLCQIGAAERRFQFSDRGIRDTP